MGVHGVRVVSASLFNCSSLKSSKNRGKYPKAFFSEKKRVFSAKWVRILPESLQIGCAHLGGPYFHNSWFAFKKGQPLVTLIVTFDCVV